MFRLVYRVCLCAAGLPFRGQRLIWWHPCLLEIFQTALLDQPVPLKLSSFHLGQEPSSGQGLRWNNTTQIANQGNTRHTRTQTNIRKKGKLSLSLIRWKQFSWWRSFFIPVGSDPPRWRDPQSRGDCPVRPDLHLQWTSHLLSVRCFLSGTGLTGSCSSCL